MKALDNPSKGSRINSGKVFKEVIAEKVKKAIPAARLPDGQGRQEKLEYGFGPHLILDCYGCPKEKLSDLDLVFDTLDTFPERIGMAKIMPPYVFKYRGASPDEWGVSGVVLIEDSQITIHTFPDKQHAFIDIFSCREFDASAAAAYMVELFEAASHEVQLSSRGFGPPREAVLVRPRL